ncbi:MAG: hypothetical protein ACUVRK_12135 [Spirochaetota bacterium]
MKRLEILNNYLATHSVPELIAKKLDANSFLTNNFAYHALRIGNSIGDNLDISIEIIILDEIAKKYNLILNTTEHAQLHTQGITETDLDSLVQAAILFENIKNNKKQYKEILRKISYFIRKEFYPVIHQD